MELPQVDGASPPDTDLGLLQRGRGLGWLRAAGSDSGVELFLKCIERDPRWDHQVESRTDYYASLALRLSVPASSLLPVSEEADDEGFRLGILEAMAQRGSAGATHELAVVAKAHEALPAGTATDELAVLRARPGPVEIDAPIDILLAESRHPFRKAVLHRLRSTRDAREVEALRQASLDSSSPGWDLALQVLGPRGDPAPLPSVESVLIADAPGAQRAAAFGYACALPPSVSLPIARTWLAHSDGRGSVAASVLAAHAELVDVLAIRSALGDATDYYAICGLAEALARLPEAGPFPELQRVYEESAYSYARARAVDAMAVTDPEFAQKWATECLWDCEASTRRWGAQAAPGTALVRTRLRELVDDPQEVDAVRDVARVRVH